MSAEATSDNNHNSQPRERSKLLTVCPYILGNEFGERLAYYGLASNLVNYFKDLGASSSSAASAVSAWSGFCYVFPLLGGWVADSHLGRYKTILIFSLIYLIGMALLTGSAAVPGIRVDEGENANGAQWTLLTVSLLLVSAGTGGIKPNVSSFGADQFDDTKEQDRREKQSFFNWFYFFINVGGLIASTVIVYIQDQDMWDIGFGIPALALLVAVIMFLAGRPLYKIEAPSESPLARFVKVTRAAIRNKGKSGAHAHPDNPNAPLIQNSRGAKNHWLDWAVGPDDFTEQQVYEIKLVYGLFPVFFTAIFYWLVYLQMFGLFILQGDQMDREVTIFGKETKIPAASMSLFNTGSIVLLIPIYDLLLLPALKRYLNYKPTLLQRTGAGYFLAFLAMTSAYALERVRLKRYNDGEFHTIVDDGDVVEVVDLSIWWQIVLYVLIGASEVLASIGMLEFFYNQAPDSMRSMMSALNLLATSLGGYVSSLLLYVVNQGTSSTGNKWVADNLNEGHLDYFYLLLAVLMLAVLVWFLSVAMRYKYKHVAHAEEGETVDPIRLAQTMGRSVAYHGEDPDSIALL